MSKWPSTATVVVLAGEDYRRPLESLLEQYRFDVEWPFRQGSLTGIGDQMQWLSEQTGDGPPSTPTNASENNS